MAVVVVVVSLRNRLNRLPAQPIPAFNPSCFNFCLIWPPSNSALCDLRLLRILPVAHPARFLLFPPKFIHLINLNLTSHSSKLTATFTHYIEKHAAEHCARLST